MPFEQPHWMPSDDKAPAVEREAAVIGFWKKNDNFAKSLKAREGAETFVFVEVKTRSSDRYTAPEGAVDADKRRRMQKVADYYLNTGTPPDNNAIGLCQDDAPQDVVIDVTCESDDTVAGD